jgi:hypothetical protein
MFSYLKDVVDLIRSAITDFRKFKSKRERKAIVLHLLKLSFMLKDCVDEGEELVEEAGSNPVAKINAMPGDEAISTLTRWDLILHKQGRRLYELQGYIYGEHHLAVINPRLQDKLSKVIGDKMQRTVTLHGIGATLFLRNMFPIENTNNEKARLVALMAGVESEDALDIQKVHRDIAELRNSLDEYSAVVHQLVSREELFELTTKAREATLIRE